MKTDFSKIEPVTTENGKVFLLIFPLFYESKTFIFLFVNMNLQVLEDVEVKEVGNDMTHDNSQCIAVVSNQI